MIESQDEAMEGIEFVAVSYVSSKKGGLEDEREQTVVRERYV
jgi:hypothetical protein